MVPAGHVHGRQRSPPLPRPPPSPENGVLFLALSLFGNWPEERFQKKPSKSPLLLLDTGQQCGPKTRVPGGRN